MPQNFLQRVKDLVETLNSWQAKEKAIMASDLLSSKAKRQQVEVEGGNVKSGLVASLESLFKDLQAAVEAVESAKSKAIIDWDRAYDPGRLQYAAGQIPSLLLNVRNADDLRALVAEIEASGDRHLLRALREHGPAHIVGLFKNSPEERPAAEISRKLMQAASLERAAAVGDVAGESDLVNAAVAFKKLVGNVADEFGVKYSGFAISPSEPLARLFHQVHIEQVPVSGSDGVQGIETLVTFLDADRLPSGVKWPYRGPDPATPIQELDRHLASEGAAEGGYRPVNTGGSS